MTKRWTFAIDTAESFAIAIAIAMPPCCHPTSSTPGELVDGTSPPPTLPALQT